MTELLIALWLLAALGWFWSAGRSAAEAAREHGRRACAEAGVLWLDQSVHLTGLRLRRRDDGWIGIEREYRFEYSRDGETRQGGRVVLFGCRLMALSGPEAT